MPDASFPDRMIANRLSALGLLLAGAAAFGWPLSAAAQSSTVAQTDPAHAQDLAPVEGLAPAETLAPVDDAWFTGPMLANSASTLPRGHVLIEPYLYDVMVSGRHSFGSLTYILYGLTDELTLGAKPSFTLIEGDRRRRARIGVGDLTVQAQYRLRSPRPRSWSPALALSLQLSLPIGRYDRLGDRPAAGLGNGSFGTTIALYAQSAGRLANGRTLRARLNLSATLQTARDVRGVSVYGTGEGFVGRAKGGSSAHVGIAFEYSVTRNWALALDVIADRRNATTVAGTAPDSNGMPIDEMHRSRPGWAYGVAPGVEYSWTPNLGVLVAARFVAAGPTGPASVTPAIALNMVF